MEAPLKWAVRTVVLVAISILVAPAIQASGYRTANFIVDAPTPQLAKEIGETAERCRRELAKEWLGKELPNWSKPCPIKAKVSPGLGAGGATSFIFDRGRVFGWRMEVQGSRERVLDSVIPHEVTHTIFASHFRQPVPRWADEGACTTVEHPSEIAKQERMLIEFLQTRRAIPFSAMFAMKEYPSDVLPLYAQGHSLAQFLIYQRGKGEFIAFLENGMRDENWPRALSEHYGYPDLLVLQNSWMDWVRSGRPELQLASDVKPQTRKDQQTSASENTLVRGQNPGPSNTPRPPYGAVADQASIGAQGRDNSPADNNWQSIAASAQPANRAMSNEAGSGEALQRSGQNTGRLGETVYESLSRGAAHR